MVIKYQMTNKYTKISTQVIPKFTNIGTIWNPGPVQRGNTKIRFYSKSRCGKDPSLCVSASGRMRGSNQIVKK
jgi:hypothetical protein